MTPAASPERPGKPGREGLPEIVLGLVVWAVGVFGLVAQLGRLDKLRGASAGRSRVVALVEMDG